MKHSRDLNLGLRPFHFIYPEFPRSFHHPTLPGLPSRNFFFSLSRISRISPPFPSPDFPAASAFFPGFSSTFLSSPSFPALNCPFPLFLLVLPFPFFGISFRFVSFRFIPRFYLPLSEYFPKPETVKPKTRAPHSLQEPLPSPIAMAVASKHQMQKRRQAGRSSSRTFLS